VDRFVAAEKDRPSRPEAIRRLIERAPAGSPSGQRSPKARSRAQELASAQVDKLADQSATHDERQQRKRRLLKGPGEFRDIRDEVRSKAKR
jgi:hypothetical protein